MKATFEFDSIDEMQQFLCHERSEVGEQERPIDPDAQKVQEQVENRDTEAGAAEDLSPGGSGADATDVDARSEPEPTAETTDGEE